MAGSVIATAAVSVIRPPRRTNASTASASRAAVGRQRAMTAGRHHPLGRSREAGRRYSPCRCNATAIATAASGDVSDAEVAGAHAG